MKTYFAEQQYRMIHDIYVLLDDGDRRVLREYDLSISQFSVLNTLDDNLGWRLTDVSSRLLIDKSTVTRIIDRLERAGLVRRDADPTDRRVQRVVLTDRGRLLRDQARRAQSESLVERLSILDTTEQQQLQDLLQKLRDGLLSRLAADPLVSS
ncbi:MAG: MarR family transcriptional regulator [Oscillochloris sp.]|nr:MarR family transcriptional regulator [Oscillochloris sp.]